MLVAMWFRCRRAACACALLGCGRGPRQAARLPSSCQLASQGGQAHYPARLSQQSFRCRSRGGSFVRQGYRSSGPDSSSLAWLVRGLHREHDSSFRRGHDGPVWRLTCGRTCGAFGRRSRRLVCCLAEASRPLCAQAPKVRILSLVSRNGWLQSRKLWFPSVPTWVGPRLLCGQFPPDRKSGSCCCSQSQRGCDGRISRSGSVRCCSCSFSRRAASGSGRDARWSPRGP